MDEYTFRREFYFGSLFPESIVQFKKSREFRKMSLTEKNEFYDSMYEIYKRHFLSKFVSDDEKAQLIMDRGLEELEKTLQ
ncbi:hypothetical protein [Desulfosporosinus sp. SB140]|uniref:hypothetical protein n=1 Tax=Desulfosporosinus paludis TaxID=3115649 RepID=UPI00388E3EE3